MAVDPQDQQEIRLYLLGRLTPEQRSQRVEERMLTEPDYYEELLVAEDEIVDEYLSDALSAEEREEFERHFLSTPERVRKLRFARSLRGYVAAVPGPAPVPPRLLDRLRPLFASPLRVAAAAAVVALVVCSLLAWRVYFRPDARVGEGLAALHRAYSGRRPVEARIIGWQYAPWSVTRSGAQPEADAVSLALAERLLLDAAHERPSAASQQALARLFIAEKKLDQAVALLEGALKADDGNASLHNDLGVALLEKARAGQGGGAEKEIDVLAHAAEQFERAIRLDNSLTEAYFNRALAYQEMGLRRQAEEGWEEYLRRDADSAWAGEARRNLKQLEEGAQAAPDARGALRDFLKAAHAGDDTAAWQVVSRSYTSAGSGIANSILDAELGLAPVGDDLEAGAALPALAYLARLEQERDGDRFTFDLVTQYERAGRKRRGLLAEARGHARAAYELFTQSKWAEAIAEYEKAGQAYERAGDEAGRAFIEYRLAHCYVFLPDLEKARAGFGRLSAASETSHYRWLHAHSLYGLAHVSINSNELSKGADYSARALSAFERAGDLNGVLRCLVQLADINRDFNRPAQSLDYLRRGLAMMDEGPAEPLQRWGILVQVAFCLASLRLNAAALSYQKEALSLALNIGRPLLVSRSYGYVGIAFAAAKMYAAARDSAAHAFEIGAGLPAGLREEVLANASQQFGDIFRQEGDCGRAQEAYDRSIRLYEELNVPYYMYPAHKGKFLCFMEARDDAAAGRELQTVLSLFERYRAKITGESQRLSFFDKQQAVYDSAILYGYERMRDPAVAFGYSEESRARSLLALLRRGGAAADGSGADDNSDAPEASLPLDVRPMTLAEIQGGFPEDSQVIQYAMLEDRLIIWVVTRSGFQVKVVPVGAQELERKVRAYLAAASASPEDDGSALAAAADLYRILIAPAEPFLDRGKFLCIVPDKVLNYLPFAALQAPATGRYLLEDFDLGLAPSSSVFVAESEAAVRKAGAREERLLSVGEPSFDRAAFPALPALPSAAKEAAAVSEFYRPGRRVLIGSEAGEESVRAELLKADVVHFATHYVADESSVMRSGFPLAPERTAAPEGADGFLQSQEIYGMRLPQTRLVVLSACGTGIEQQYGGEGAVGVARSFLVAGVPLVVATLWPVDTDASADLMVSFHRHRRRDSLPAAQALRRAQIEMARGAEARYRHPYYWASFVAIGGHTSF